jgi:hypothetical protein
VHVSTRSRTLENFGEGELEGERLHFFLTQSISSDRVDFDREVSAFRPRGVPGPTSKLSLRVPALMGRCETGHKGGEQ